MDSEPVNRTAGARSFLSWRVWAAGAVLAAAAAAGCEGEPQQAGGPKKLEEVQVSALVPDYVADYEVFTGRVQTTHYLDIKARVTGYLKEAGFKEGEDVRKDQVLFKIDSRPYDAMLAQTAAMVAQASTHLQTAEDTYSRDLRSPAATSDAALTQDRDAVEEAKAALKQAEANRQAAQNNVDYCVIKAPFDGRISRLNVDPENDVIADNTVLASLVQLDPLYAYFDVDERTLLDIGALLPEGKITPRAAEVFPLTLGLANQKPEEFTHKGTLKIADNKVDSTTGTLRMWGTFDNAAHDLKPGLFVRVRMDKGRPKQSLFVYEAAIGSDQGRNYVYVVGADNKAAYTQVEKGQKKDGLIAIKPAKGYELKPGDRVVVNGLQRIHPILDEKTGQLKPVEIQPQEVPMPRAKNPDEESVVKAAEPGKKE
jgi:RND family efflux transporter MFP subunit